jgi:hypothetical protein
MRGCANESVSSRISGSSQEIQLDMMPLLVLGICIDKFRGRSRRSKPIIAIGNLKCKEEKMLDQKADRSAEKARAQQSSSSVKGQSRATTRFLQWYAGLRFAAADCASASPGRRCTPVLCFRWSRFCFVAQILIRTALS